MSNRCLAATTDPEDLRFCWDLYEPVGIKPAIKGAAPTDK